MGEYTSELDSKYRSGVYSKDKIRKRNLGRRVLNKTRNLQSFAARGSKANGSKLTETQVLAIKHRLESGEKQMVIAKDYRVDPSTISDINIGRTWGWML